MGNTLSCVLHPFTVENQVYLPSAFQESRIDVLHAMMRANPLATLVTVSEAGLVADHIPMQVRAAVPHGLLRGHVARANPLWRRHPAGQEALAVFQGPQAYISPSLYPTKHETGAVVPTWDYAVVHAYGSLRFIEDAAGLLELVSSLTDAHEAPRATPWKVADAPVDYIDKMLGAIVGFEFSITRITGKWKVSQNRNAADQRGVIDGLRAAGDLQSQAIADLLATRGASSGDRS
jgi:transcriptional regulator